LQDYYSSGNFTEKRHKAYLNRLAEMEKRLDKIANHEIYLIPMETTPTKKRSGKRLHDLKGLDLVVSGNRELLKARQARAAK